MSSPLRKVQSVPSAHQSVLREAQPENMAFISSTSPTFQAERSSSRRLPQPENMPSITVTRRVSRYSTPETSSQPAKPANHQAVETGRTSAKLSSNTTRRTSPAISCQGRSPGVSMAASGSSA